MAAAAAMVAAQSQRGCYELTCGTHLFVGIFVVVNVSVFDIVVK